MELGKRDKEEKGIYEGKRCEQEWEGKGEGRNGKVDAFKFVR